MPFSLLPFPNAETLATAAATNWLASLAAAEPTNRRLYTVAISGGRVARNFFSEIVRLVQEPSGAYKSIFADNEIHFFWADERCVPPSDPESNFAIAQELLFRPLKIPAAQIHRLKGEGPEAPALQEAIQELSRASGKANGQPVLDMIFLGTGEDGHIASLFPGESEQVRNDPAVYRAVTAVKPPPRRFTLGYAAIVAAKECWVLASGSGKEAALKQSLSPQGQTPLARVIRMRSMTRIYTDVALPQGV